MTAARQIQTRKWWDGARSNYDLYVSALVIEEASRGNETLASERLNTLADLPLLAVNEEVNRIGDALLKGAALPGSAKIDALHIATAAFHGVGYLLTWNCKHIANARTRPRIEQILKDDGCAVPVICTPDELMSDE